MKMNESTYNAMLLRNIPNIGPDLIEAVKESEDVEQYKDADGSENQARVYLHSHK
jgi:hypothetical protein